MKHEKEILFFPKLTFRTEKRESRDAGGAEPTVITGHAAVFNVTTDLGYFSERIKPGAFAQSIVADDIRALFNHNPDYVLGRNKAGTLTLTEDEVGLRCDIFPPDNEFCRSLMGSINRGDITGASIGFYARAYEIERDKDTVTRILTRCELLDVSPVTYPAYVETDMGVRSVEDIFNEFRNGPDEAAKLLRESQEIALREAEERGRLLSLAEFL